MAASPSFSFPPFRPPPPPSPPPSPDNDTTLIVIVFVSCGGLLFLAFVAAAICCYIKKKKNKASSVQEPDIKHVDEHLKIEEAIVPGRHGPQAVILEIVDDVHVDEVVKKNETFGRGGPWHAKSRADQSNNNNPSSAKEPEEGSSDSDHHQIGHNV